ncbi:MAG: phosphoribosylamine--glycine ligase [Oscillospiraceae bacterium]|nr:phosphoribosylamine--glycine ligase [Oscillospiraceae bacterium]
MKILVLGSGGREHAIIRALAQSPRVTKLYAAPGNGGIAQLAECVDIAATDIEAVRDFAVANAIDFAVPAGDSPLVAGAVDALEGAGIPCFGPNKAAAQIEGSKVFSKDLMRNYNIPTAGYEVFDDAAAALAYLDTCAIPTVIKADGLALGKGVIIAQTRDEAKLAVREIMLDKKFGASGNRIVVEEFLTGPEVSVLSFTDGKTVVPMVSSMDHKRALDGDKGLNTGGMGVIAPNPFYTTEISTWCEVNVFTPTIEAMAAEGCPFKGCLYFGLMLTPNGPRVIEYNCRFGDPEAQVVLPLLNTDLLDIFEAVQQERLAELDIQWKDESACCVVIASGGYPEKYSTGHAISFGDAGDAFVYHAGTKLAGGDIVTAGGRVLGITATGASLQQAMNKAYAAVDNIHFDGAFYRKDIGQKALQGS